MTVRDWYEFVEMDLSDENRFRFRRMHSGLGFDDLYVERTENNGLCDLCSDERRLYIVWNRGQMRESEQRLACSTCVKRMRDAIDNGERIVL